MLAGVTILLVEDEPDITEILVDALFHEGAKVMTAASGEAALVTLDETVPDVVISDLGLPGIDGLELMRRVRLRAPERGGQVPAIALTGRAREEDRGRVLGAGYQLHVPKPIDFGELIDAVVALTR